MVPSSADIARYRHIAAAVVRGVGLMLLLYSGARLGVHLWDRYWGMVNAIAGGGPVRPWLTAVPKLHLVLGAASLFVLARPRRIARWLVPWPADTACPCCRFSLERFRAHRCPECGVVLGPDFHAPPAEPPPGPVQSPDGRSQ